MLQLFTCGQKDFEKEKNLTRNVEMWFVSERLQFHLQAADLVCGLKVSKDLIDSCDDRLSLWNVPDVTNMSFSRSLIQLKPLQTPEWEDMLTDPNATISFLLDVFAQNKANRLFGDCKLLPAKMCCSGLDTKLEYVTETILNFILRVYIGTNGSGLDRYTWKRVFYFFIFLFLDRCSVSGYCSSTSTHSYQMSR